jgi:hypothetical protein
MVYVLRLILDADFGFRMELHVVLRHRLKLPYLLSVTTYLSAQTTTRFTDF